MFQSTEQSPHIENKASNLEAHPTGEEIELRAYQIYVERGGADGHDVDDWACKPNVNCPRNIEEPSR